MSLTPEPASSEAQRNAVPLKLRVLAFAVCVISGMMLPTQTGMNVRMAKVLGHPLRAALYSDFCATLTLALITAINFSLQANDKRPVASRLSSISFTRIPINADECNVVDAFPNDNLSLRKALANLLKAIIVDREWVLIPCTALGVYFGTVAIYVAPRVGPSIFFISMLLGQLTTSVFLDKTGYLWNTPRSLIPANYFGIALLFTGVVLFNVDCFEESKIEFTVFALYMALSILSGVALVIGSSINKRIRYHVGSPFRAALVSFALGVFVCALCNLVTLATNPNASVDGSQMRWYAWFGGCLSAMFVTATIVCPPIIGFSASFTCIVTGNLALSLTYDALGAFGFPKDKVSLMKLSAVLLVICAALLVNWTQAMSQSLIRALGVGKQLPEAECSTVNKQVNEDELL